MKKLTEEQIDNLVAELNCSAISDFMYQTNWTWFRSENGVPTPQEIAAEARRLLRKVNDDGEAGALYIETGGLRAVRDGAGVFEIMFIAARSSVYVNGD